MRHMQTTAFSNWTNLLTDFIQRTSTELPADIVRALEAGRVAEAPGKAAATTLDTILTNASLAREKTIPMCQDTGTLTFWIDVPRGVDTLFFEDAVCTAVRRATENGCLRLNVIAVPSGQQVPDNVGAGNPTIYLTQKPVDRVTVSLLMKGGGCENVSTQYSLPDSQLNAGRDLEGVRRCVLDAVWKAQGNGCAPGILGVCVGGDRANGYAHAKEQLLRSLDDASPVSGLAELERRLLVEANRLGIGPMGLGGHTTLLGVKIGTRPRLPASFFVTIAYGCWASRRGRIEASVDGIC